MERRAVFLIDYSEAYGPVGVRGLYYQAEVAHLPGIDKEEASYGKIQEQVLTLRRGGRISYFNIADATRWMRKPPSYRSIKAAARECAQTYRRNLWRDADDYVEIWIGKDALAGVVYPVTEEYDVPLMSTRGFSSETFAFNAIDARNHDPRDYYVYYFDDFDRAGGDAGNSLKEKLERFASGKTFRLIFETIALTEQQIERYDLGHAKRPPKRKIKADQNWPYDFAVELDALPPDTLRALVRDAIERHLPREQLEILKVVEQSEREFLERWAETATSFEFSTDEEAEL
jgi:hypothetical protein